MLRQAELRDVCVLELVDHQVVVPVLVALENGGTIPEQLDRSQEQVVEVQSVVLCQNFLVVPVNTGANLFEVVPGGLTSHGLRIQQHALRLGDSRQNGTRREPLGVVVRHLQALPDGGNLVVVIEY